MKTIYLANGVNYITPRAIQLMNQFGYSCRSIDEAPNRAGFCDLQSTEQAYNEMDYSDRLIVNFDKKINKFNHIQSKLTEDPRVIYTKLDLTSNPDFQTTSKIDNIRALEKHIDSNLKEILTIPKTMEYSPSETIVKVDDSRGSKGVHLLESLVNTKDTIILQEKLNSNKFKVPLVLTLSVVSGEVYWTIIAYWDSPIGELQGQFNYNTIGLLESDNLKNSDNEIESILGRNQFKVNLKPIPVSTKDTFQSLAEFFVNSYKIIDGVCSIELYSTEDFSEFGFIESDFRLCDISWLYSSAQHLWLDKKISVNL